MPQKRIVSLLAAGTEMVCALGLEKQLVGISHECDYPESIKTLPVCSEASFGNELSSAEIDAKVRQTVYDALSVYKIDKALIGDLQPDVVITQNQCEVCAVAEKDVELALRDIASKDTKLFSLAPNTLQDILQEIADLAKVLDAEDAGEKLLEDLQERIDIIKHKLKFFPDKPKVAVIEWLSPLMIAGNWVPELVEIAGGTPILAENGKHSPFIEWQQIYDANPDIIVIANCGFDIGRSLQEIDLLLNQPGWRDVEAVKNNSVYIADGNAYFNRSGPRIVDTIEILAEIITPKYFAFGYEGTAWIKFEI